MKKVAKWVVALCLVAFGVMQFFNPVLTNPPVGDGQDMMTMSGTNAPPPAIAAIIHNSCYNCHSYETKWPWYSHVAPMSWLLAGHVNDGREAMNFSEWPDDPDNAGRRWLKISHIVDEGEMPLSGYTLIHSAARLSSDQRKQLVDWTAAEGKKLKK